jgi:glycine cleavage system H protein
MSELKFTKQHEWLLLDGDVVTVGITDFAQQQLGDIVFIDLPDEGKEISVGDEIVVIESVKAAGEVHSPLSGTVVAINEQLADTPELVNDDPTGAGWFYRAKVYGDADLSGLMSENDYGVYLSDEHDS